MVEIEIGIPYGVIAAKWWGRRDVRPILCVHGLLDNAASFDSIIPLLPDTVGYLAIDMPGHGKSSRMPPGLVYTFVDDIYIINYIVRKLGWDKVALMGHAAGAISSFLFAATFPDRVELVVALDELQPRVLSQQYIDYLIPSVERMRDVELKHATDTEPPTYTIDEMVEKVNAQTLLAVSRPSAMYLLARAAKESGIQAGRWHFTADTRLKWHQFPMYAQDVNESFATSIECPFMYVKYLQSPYAEAKANTDSVLEILMEKPNFAMLTVDGDRYVHLNDPRLLSDGIGEFIADNLDDKARDHVASKL